MAANFVLGTAQLANPEYTIERWHTCLVTYLLLLMAGATNIWARPILDKLSRIMVVFNILSFVIVTVVILAMDKNKQSAAFVFKDFQNFSGFSPAYASLLGLLQGAFVMTGYGMLPLFVLNAMFCSTMILASRWLNLQTDATAHMIEEIKDPRKAAPKAIIWAVWIGSITGFIFLVAMCFCIDDINVAAASPTGVPAIQIFYSATGSFAATMAMSIQISIISITSLAFVNAQSSRLAFAFARDHGLPFSTFFSKVNPKTHVPVHAILVVVGVNFALMSIYFGSITGFNTILAISTEGFCKYCVCRLLQSLEPAWLINLLDLSYIMPLAVRLWGRWTGKGPEFTKGSYTLSRTGVYLNIIGLLYLAFACITFNFPSSYPINGTNMNYTCAAVGGIIIIAATTWFAKGRTAFTGPQIGSNFEMEMIVATQAADGDSKASIRTGEGRDKNS